MCILKWELRYPELLLLLLLLCGVWRVHADASCDSENAQNPKCRSGGGYLWEITNDGSCKSSKCFVNNSVDQYEELLDGHKLTPKLTRKGAYQVGETLTFTCSAWADNFSTLVGMEMFISTKPKVAVKLKTNRRYYFLSNTSLESGAAEAVMTLVLKDNLHGHNITCRMILDSGDMNMSEAFMNREDRFKLYAFYETNPVIYGPKEVEVGLIYIWKCSLEKSTVNTKDDVKVRIYSNPTTPTAPVKSFHIKDLKTFKTYKRVEAVATIKFSVPPTFQPAFFINCRTSNAALGTSRQVIKFADIMRVAVIIKDHDLSDIFTIVGVCSGLGGFAMGMAMVVFYCRKRTPPPSRPKT